ncbi:hypothetical protein SJ05684_c06460 [Sinorhizobium sojae CCBAU 05684]|uniref:Uncharacterized protein n=1 Tax=Sinorhizobium sojae CCBAU 05684 TaxID=716928 RepID=A0A249P844_9HYPH|nr:hypothetical protein SJ05684_c06460 [Sinorhizobium sojae CCBAU 05684]
MRFSAIMQERHRDPAVTPATENTEAGTGRGCLGRRRVQKEKHIRAAPSSGGDR